MKTPANREAVLRTNKQVDRALVAAFESLDTELKKLGVQIKPTYSLSPPLGEFPRFAFNHYRLPPKTILAYQIANHR